MPGTNCPAEVAGASNDYGQGEDELDLGVGTKP